MLATILAELAGLDYFVCLFNFWNILSVKKYFNGHAPSMSNQLKAVANQYNNCMLGNVQTLFIPDRSKPTYIHARPD
jgi:hypothetical protein